jgi:hypothetical protein
MWAIDELPFVLLENVFVLSNQIHGPQEDERKSDAARKDARGVE